MLSKRGTVARIYMPPDANTLLSVADHCLRSRDYVNLIVIDKQPQLQCLDMETAIEHCARGASIWHRASNDDGGEPDVVLGARATSRPSRRWPRRGGCGSSSRTCGCAWSTWST